jgi:hypothetical protein
MINEKHIEKEIEKRQRVISKKILWEEGWNEGYQKACEIIQLLDDRDLISDECDLHRFLKDLFPHLARGETKTMDYDADDADDGCEDSESEPC